MLLLILGVEAQILRGSFITNSNGYLWGIGPVLFRGFCPTFECSYSTSMFSTGNPSCDKSSLHLLRWSPWRIIWLLLAVPPQAHIVFSFFVMSSMSKFLPSRPSIIVTGRLHFRLSICTLILCCSLLMVSQTQMSMGRPHFGQISAMLLFLKLLNFV